MDWADYAKERLGICERRKAEAIERFTTLLAQTESSRACEEADRLTYPLVEQYAWLSLNHGIEHGLRTLNSWLDNRTQYGSEGNRMVQRIRREVALGLIQEIMCYLTDEQMRSVVGGIKAVPYGDVD